MGRNRQADSKTRKVPTAKTPRRIDVRVNAAWDWVSALRPDLTPAEKHQLTGAVLGLCEMFPTNQPPSSPPHITAAQVTEMVWRNSQCIQRSCPMLLFADRIAIELNAFFSGNKES